MLYDVVLIDTAGRRHNDTRLMSSLTKFGQLANPDKIFMVGEALVGSDSVAQARNFAKEFVDTKVYISHQSHARYILLTSNFRVNSATTASAWTVSLFQSAILWAIWLVRLSVWCTPLVSLWSSWVWVSTTVT
jgi:hypothetical protein